MSLRTFDGEEIVLRTIDGETLYDIIENDVKSTISATPAGTMSDGTASTPGLEFASDTDTGVFRPATNTFGITAGGAERLAISSTEITARVDIHDRRHAFYHGATGDGVTDDTTALQNAINFVKSNGGSLYIPAGTYLITTGLNLSSNTKSYGIYGDGQDTIIKRSSGAISIFDGNTIDGLIIKDLYIHGNQTAVPTGNHGIILYDCDNVLIDNVYVFDQLNSAINLYVASGTHGNNWIRNCYVDGNGVANNGILLVDMLDSGIVNCSVEGLDSAGSPSYCLQLKDECKRCVIENSTSSGGKVGVVFGNDAIGTSDGCEQCIINNCVVYAPTNNGFVCTTGLNNIVSNVVIDMNNAGNEPVLIDDSNASHIAEFYNINNITIKNKAPAKDAVRLDTYSDNNYIHVASIDPADTTSIVRFNASTANNNTVIIEQMDGDYTADWSGFINDSGTNNKVIYRDNSSTYLQLVDGAVSTPAIQFQKDTNLGLYRIGADNLGVGCNGIPVLDISQSNIINTSTQATFRPLTVLSTTYDAVFQVGDGISTYVDIARIDENNLTLSSGVNLVLSSTGEVNNGSGESITFTSTSVEVKVGSGKIFETKSDHVAFSYPQQWASYTVAGLPTPVGPNDWVAFATNSANGRVPCYYDGSAWRYFSDNNLVTT